METRTVLVLAALLAAAAAAAAIHAQPRLPGATATLTIEVQGLDHLVPGAHHLYGWATAWATAPGAELSTTAEIKPGTTRLEIKIPVEKLIKESRKTTASLSTRLHEASTVTVTLYLYDERGNHYIASAVIGSYDLALRETHDPRRAYHLVKNDPYYLYHHSRTLALTPRDFAVVNATPTLSYVADHFYTHPEHASQAPRGETRPAPQSHRLTCRDVVTVDNYWSYHQNYGLELSSNDFIVLPELYQANMPQEFASRVSGADPHWLYNRLKHVYGTAVYVPATCAQPVTYAVYQWYHVPPGLHRLSDFLTRLAGRHIDWRDVKQPGTLDWLYHMPILRLTGSCGSNCDATMPRISISLAYARHRYYESGLSILGLINLGEEHEVINVNTAGEAYTPLDAKQKAVVYILADILRTWRGDYVYVDYRLERIRVYSIRDGRWYDFWRVEPVLAFTPAHDDYILAISSLYVTPGNQYYYNEYQSKFLKMLGHTAITVRTIYDRYVHSYDASPEVIDSTVSRSYGADAVASAVYGVASDALEQLIASIAGKASKLADKLLNIAGIFVSYAYANREAQATAINLERSSGAPAGTTVHVVVKRYEQFIETDTYEYEHNVSLKNPRPPLAMTYYVEFNPASHSLPPSPPNPPTKKSP